MHASEWLQRTVAWFDRVLQVFAIVSGLFLVALVCLTMVDVVLRYLFNSPIFGAQDAAEVMLLVVVFLSLAYCGRTHGHIGVDVFTRLLGRRILRVTEPLLYLIGAAVIAVLAWHSAQTALDAFASGRASNLIAIPYWPFYSIISIGSLFYAVVLLADAVRALRGDLPGLDEGR